jgi:hypothetical protein
MENTPNLEQDLQRSDYLLEKIRTRNDYAQNLYAALCNMRWQRLEVLPILKEEYWSCSWRAAGGMVARLRNHNEDYMDYYCSGIQDFSSDEADPRFNDGGYVAEGIVTEEIQNDLKDLGWVSSPWPND